MLFDWHTFCCVIAMINLKSTTKLHGKNDGSLFLCLLIVLVSSLPSGLAGQEFLWTKLIQYAGDIYPATIAVDADGNSFVTGSFYGTVSFGSTNLTWVGGSDAFVAKYDPEG